MEELRELVRRCKTADRRQQQLDFKKYVESTVMNPDYIQKVKDYLDLKTIQRESQHAYYVDLDPLVKRYLWEETVLVNSEAFEILRWNQNDEFIASLNHLLGYEHTKLVSANHGSYSTDDSSHDCIKFNFSTVKPVPPPPVVEDKVQEEVVERCVKRILKTCAFAAFLGIPEVTVEIYPWYRIDNLTPSSLKAIKERVGSFEILPKAIKVKVDSSRFELDSVKQSLDKINSLIKQKVFKYAANHTKAVIDHIKRNIRVYFERICNPKTFPFGQPRPWCLVDIGGNKIWDLIHKIVPPNCPELDFYTVITEFTPSEEKKLNDILGLEGFKMRVQNLDWRIEFPPEFLQ